MSQQFNSTNSTLNIVREPSTVGAFNKFPTTGNKQQIQFTSLSGWPGGAVQLDESITGTGRRQFAVQSGFSNDLSINGNLKADMYDDLLIFGALGSTNGFVAVDDSTLALASVPATQSTGQHFTMPQSTVDNLRVGAGIKVGGFSDEANNGVFTITGITGTSVFVAGSGILTADTAAAGTVEANIAIDGPNEYSYSYDRAFYRRDQANALVTRSMASTGNRVQDVTIASANNALTTIAINLMGCNYDTFNDGSGISSLPQVKAPGVNLISSNNDVAGVGIAGQYRSAITDLNITISNNLAASMAIDSKNPIDQVQGMKTFVISGNGFFYDMDDYHRYENSETFSLVYSIQGNDGTYYTFYAPNCVYTDPLVLGEVSDNNQPIPYSFTAEAIQTDDSNPVFLISKVK